MAQQPAHRHVLYRSPSEASGLRNRQSPGDAQCSSVLYIPTGGESVPVSTAPEPSNTSNRSELFVQPSTNVECHRTGIQMPVNVDTQPTRLFASPRPRPQAPTGSPRPVVVMNRGAMGPMPAISCRDNVLEIRPASGDCCVRVNASPGGKVRIKIPSTQQSSRVTRFRIADSLKLYGEVAEEPYGTQGATAGPLRQMGYPPDFHYASPPTSIRLVGLRPRADAARAARTQKRHSYAFEGDNEEAVHESRIDNFVLESLSEVCDAGVKSESKIFHILANKIENQGPEAGNLWTAFSIPELLNFLKILEIEERDMKKAVIFKYKLLKYRISKLMSAQRRLSQ